ncbi:MAG: helix-turn-helix transcriptional regulator [Clostridiales bacterium]|nr:helix-turn-helix transcriptional regulator [Clostridiales bacterium]
MGLKYRINLLEELKASGYNTNRIRKEKLMAEATLQNLRAGKPISWANIERCCAMLNCQPGDILEYVPDEEKEGE